MADPWMVSGPGAWLASRAAGFTAYTALTLEIALGLFLSTGIADGWIARARSVEMHRWLSGGTIALLLAHASALLLDRTVSFRWFDLVVPFSSGYRPVPVGLGGLALWLVLVIHASFSLRSWLGNQRWRRLHQASFAVYLLATAHGWFAGTDSARFSLLYALSGALVLGMVLLRAALPARAAGKKADAA